MSENEYQKLEIPDDHKFEVKGGIYYSYGKHSKCQNEVKKDLTKLDIVKKYSNRFKRGKK